MDKGIASLSNKIQEGLKEYNLAFKIGASIGIIGTALGLLVIAYEKINSLPKQLIISKTREFSDKNTKVTIPSGTYLVKAKIPLAKEHVNKIYLGSNPVTAKIDYKHKTITIDGIINCSVDLYQPNMTQLGTNIILNDARIRYEPLK